MCAMYVRVRMQWLVVHDVRECEGAPGTITPVQVTAMTCVMSILSPPQSSMARRAALSESTGASSVKILLRGSNSSLLPVCASICMCMCMYMYISKCKWR